MSRNVLLLPGDGIGPEIVAEAEKVLHKVNDQFGLGLGFESALVGGAAIDETDTPLPEETLEKARKADAILLGANLTDANLTNADLTGAELRIANLTNTYLKGATYDSTTNWPTAEWWDNTTCPDGTNSNDPGNETCGFTPG